MFKRCILLVVALLSSTSYAKTYTVFVGDAPVNIHYIKGKGKTFIHVHQNETTALKAARKIIQKEGGSLITLRHSGGRNIIFHFKKRRYEFDPNRIFTDTGIKKTLSLYSKYSPEAHKEVNKLAAKLKQLLPEGKVIAVHNNSTYSLKNYLPGHDMAHDAQSLYRNSNAYYRNFYFLTLAKDYKALKSKGFNSVLQKPKASDDGSLSILLAHSSYINVEAGYDQLAEQIKMLKNA